MKKTPKTPFSTPLSGSARETEMRFKSILKWKKSRPPMIALALLLCAAFLCCSMVACQEGKDNPADPIAEESKPTVNETESTEAAEIPETTISTQPAAILEFPKLAAGDAVPDGCSYVTAEGETLNPGDPMPAEVHERDLFVTPQLVYQGYMCHVTVAGFETELGWLAALNEENINRADVTEITEPMYEKINGLPLNSMMGTYRACGKLAQVPPIPNTVRDMTGTFAQCVSLTQVSNLPQSLDNMSATFAECQSLKTVPDIPVKVVSMEKAFFKCTSLEKTPDFSHCTEFQQFNNVFEGCTNLKKICEIPECITVMNSTFKDCSSLDGTVTIHAGIHDDTCRDVFAGCSNLTLTGTCPKDGLEAMAKTGTNIQVG